MDVFFLIARILFAIGLLSSGVSILTDRRTAVRGARGSGIPSPELSIPLLGLALVVGALLIGFGILADIGAILIAAVILIKTPQHAYWNASASQKNETKSRFFRNVSLLGAVAIIFWIYNQGQGDVPFSLTDPLIGPW